MMYLIGLTYEINSGSMKIIDLKTRLFEDTIIITSDSFIIRGTKAYQTEKLFKISQDVFASFSNTDMMCDSVSFFPYNGKLQLFGNIIITRKNFIFSGDIGVYFIDYDTGYISKRFFLFKDSSIINGDYATFNRERIKILKRPVFKKKDLTIFADTIIFNFNDSTAKFINNVDIKTNDFSGLCEILFYNDINNDGYFYGNSIFSTNTDSILCDSGYFDFYSKIGIFYNTKIISKIEDGKNYVVGNIAKFFFREAQLDSLFIFSNPKGEFLKYDSFNKKP